jgi:molybdenum cofactor cytidylyltransferase
LKFGTLALDNAVGAILAHGIKHGDGVFKKGRILSTADVKALQAAGHETVIAAVLDTNDVSEDTAAYRVAMAACGSGAVSRQAFTGRANLHSSVHGLIVVDEQRVHQLNHLHESLTCATLANHAVVGPRQMVATVKIIPFAVPKDVLAQAMAVIGDIPLLRIAAFQPMRTGLVITRLPQTKPSLITKSESSIRDRLAALGSTLSDVVVCDHAQRDVCHAITSLQTKGCAPVLVFGASAIVDRADVIPAAVVEAGGEVVHLGMPVDPGNLMMLGRLHKTPVIGVPSCARSPKRNGFDWVLERIVAGLDVAPSDIMDMGAGGLLAEIASRPSPREKPPSAPRITAIVLAAGTSSRMGSNKMLADFQGSAMVRATVTQALRSSVDEVIVVTGHDKGKVEAVLARMNVRFIHNPDFTTGLSTSLRCGVSAAQNSDAVIVCLGDMPLVDNTVIDKLIAAFNPTEHRSIVLPTYQGKFGNPVLWGSEHFDKLLALDGDRGARTLIESLKADAIEIDAGSDAVLRDADTVEELRALVV